MRVLARILGLISLGFGILSVVPLRPTVGSKLARVLSPLKLVAGGLTFFSGILGIGGAVLGAMTGQTLPILAGGLGTALSARLIRRTSLIDSEFDEIFGDKRPDQIPRPNERRMLRSKWTWRMPRSQESIWERDIPFREVPENSREVLCDIWRPAAGKEQSRLAFIFFHGGSWRQYDKDTMTRTLFRHLSDQGHVVMDVAYRLYPETDMLGMLADAKHAISWMKKRADHYGIDPTRIVAAGGSSGGQIALLLAYANDHPALASSDLEDVDTSVRAVVAYYPPVDLRAYEAFKINGPIQSAHIESAKKREILASVVGGSPTDVPRLYDLLSPINHVGSHCPPTLLFLAKDDDVIPNQPVRTLKEKLKAAGTPVVLIEYPDTVHGFDLILPRYSPAAQSALFHLERFLAHIAQSDLPS